MRTTRPAWQLVELLRRFDLVTRAAPFTRCLRCNDALLVVAKDQVEDSKLPPRTRDDYREFSRCPGCARIYWGGVALHADAPVSQRAFAIAGGRG